MSSYTLKDGQTKEFFQEGWGAVSVDDALRTSYLPRSLEAFSFFEGYLPKEGKILEAGCGLANMVIFLRRKGYDVHGIDYVEHAVSKAAKYDSSLPLAVGDILSLPYPDKSFGAYLSFGVMEHFENGPVGVLKEANRVLADNGIIVMSVPYPNILTKLTIGKIDTPIRKLKRNRFIRKMFGKDICARYYKAPYAAVFSAKEVGSLLRESGFELLAIHPINHSYNLYSLSRFFRKNELGVENAFGLAVSNLLKRVSPWGTCLLSLAIGRKRPQDE